MIRRIIQIDEEKCNGCGACAAACHEGAIGMVDGKRKQGQYEIDFVVNIGNEKVYIQSALNVDTPEKKDQETFSLHNTADFFRKFVVLDGNQKMWTDDDGVIYVGVIPFLLNDYIRV